MTENKPTLSSLVGSLAAREGVVLKATNDRTSWTNVDAFIYLQYDYGRLRGLTLERPPLIYPFVTVQDRKRQIEELAAQYPHLGLTWREDS